MLKSMTPRSVCLFMEDAGLRKYAEQFFVHQAWDVDVTGPNDLVVFDGPPGVAILRMMRSRGDETPGLFLVLDRIVLRGLKYALALRPPFTPDRLRDACGALLRRRIKLVLRRRRAV
ncbi:MAG: hypothetical protein HYY16_13450 [Planctomycetes bacterium]|nr:hypothetical protein [Planctomycetota bacterium]